MEPGESRALVVFQGVSPPTSRVERARPRAPRGAGGRSARPLSARAAPRSVRRRPRRPSPVSATERARRAVCSRSRPIAAWLREEDQEVDLADRSDATSRPIEDLEDTERRLAVHERHGHEGLWHVARPLGCLAGEPRVLLEVVDHDRLPRDEHPAGDAGARREAASRRGRPRPLPRRPRRRARRSPSRAGRSRMPSAPKIARATSTIDCSSARWLSSDGSIPAATASWYLLTSVIRCLPCLQPSGRGRS